MTDFIDGLEEDLVDAAARQDRARGAAAGVRRRRLSGRTLGLIAVGLVAGGTATAAVVTGGSEPSAPLRGTLVDGERGYRVAVAPALRAGSIGWCTEITFRRGDRTLTRGNGCFASPAAAPPLLLGGLGIFGKDGGLNVTIVTSDVEVVRIGERRIRTVRNPAIPFGWRVAVTRAPAPDSPTDDPTLGPPLAERPDGTTVSPAVTQGVDQLRGRVVRADDRTPRCTLGRAAGFEAVQPRVVRGRQSAGATTATEPAYLSCAATTFRVAGTRRRIVAAILEPARSKSRVGSPGSYGLSVRGLDGAWVVASGGRPDDRARLLDRLRPAYRR